MFGAFNAILLAPVCTHASELSFRRAYSMCMERALTLYFRHNQRYATREREEEKVKNGRKEHATFHSHFPLFTFEIDRTGIGENKRKQEIGNPIRKPVKIVKSRDAEMMDERTSTTSRPMNDTCSRCSKLGGTHFRVIQSA